MQILHRIICASRHPTNFTGTVLVQPQFWENEKVINMQHPLTVNESNITKYAANPWRFTIANGHNGQTTNETETEYLNTSNVSQLLSFFLPLICDLGSFCLFFPKTSLVMMEGAAAMASNVYMGRTLIVAKIIFVGALIAEEWVAVVVVEAAAVAIAAVVVAAVVAVVVVVEVVAVAAIDMTLMMISNGGICSYESHVWNIILRILFWLKYLWTFLGLCLQDSSLEGFSWRGTGAVAKLTGSS